MSQRILTVLGDDHLDRTAAERLVHALDLEPDSDLCLDFSAVTRVEASALGILASALARADRKVKLLGLSRHEVRILEYLGVRVAAAEGDGEG